MGPDLGGFGVSHQGLDKLMCHADMSELHEDISSAAAGIFAASVALNKLLHLPPSTALAGQALYEAWSSGAFGSPASVTAPGASLILEPAPGVSLILEPSLQAAARRPSAIEIIAEPVEMLTGIGFIGPGIGRVVNRPLTWLGASSGCSLWA